MTDQAIQIERDALRADNERLKAELEHWQKLAANHAQERDSLRQTLGAMLGIHPAGIVS